MTMKPLNEAPAKDLANLQAVLSDLDDTLTLHGRMPPAAFAALHDLRRAGLKVVIVTGRPAGWCDHIARQWPVDGVVGENGAFYFRYDDGARKMTRVYAESASERQMSMAKLKEISLSVLRQFPGAAFAADQAYRETDVAIDYCEDVAPLPQETAEKVAAAFTAEKATAKISSIHVNAWFGSHDKLTMSCRMLREVFAITPEMDSARIAYCGDSPNDEPMFGLFPNSIGVANIKSFAGLMNHLPRYVTNAEGGLGFAEFTNAVLAARR